LRAAGRLESERRSGHWTPDRSAVEGGWPCQIALVRLLLPDCSCQIALARLALPNWLCQIGIARLPLGGQVLSASSYGASLRIEPTSDSGQRGHCWPRPQMGEPQTGECQTMVQTAVTHRRWQAHACQRRPHAIWRPRSARMQFWMMLLPRRPPISHLPRCAKCGASRKVWPWCKQPSTH
jgi:hypothetical protein